MEEYLFTVRSITTAQRGVFVLDQHQITSRLSRAPKSLSVAGCGYCLHIRPGDVWDAARFLREAGVQIQKYYFRNQSGIMEVEAP